MATRPPNIISPLAIVLPRPQLSSSSSARRRSPLLNSGTATMPTPRTPRTYPDPAVFLTAATNRKSTDSWNSSNQGEDDAEWLPDQLRLLSRTLEALPDHLLTPFNGPIPPSNLLDKIARGVSHAKGSSDWPHSVRATRARLLSLARARARDEDNTVQSQRRADTILEHAISDFQDSVLQPVENGRARPVYRQSSMDFMNGPRPELKDNDNISRLSNRLQRSERLLPSPAYHPYGRGGTPSYRTASRPDSFPPPGSAPSTSTLASTLTRRSTLSSGRPTSTCSSLTSVDQDVDMLPTFPVSVAEHNEQRLRRAESFVDGDARLGVVPRKKSGRKLKRAPSFGGASSGGEEDGRKGRVTKKQKVKGREESKEERAVVQVGKEEKEVDETKTGTKKKKPVEVCVVVESPKRQRTKASGGGTALATPTGEKEKHDRKSSQDRKEKEKSKEEKKAVPVVEVPPPKPPVRRNLQRNPSMFGPELPRPQPSPTMPSSPRGATRLPPALAPSPVRYSPGLSLLSVAASPSTVPPETPLTPPRGLRTLRSVRGMNIGAVSRRIEFGQLLGVGGMLGGGDGGMADGGGLGSAFQLS